MTSIRKISFLLTAVLSCILFQACDKKVSDVVERLPIVDEVLSDTASVNYVDFGSYPSDLRTLPIGILGKDSSDLSVVRFVMDADFFDNITGSADRDSIRDFAGEHFIFFTDPDTTFYSSLVDLGRRTEVTDRIVRNAARLLQDGVKIVLVASDSASTYGLTAIESLLAASGTGVKVLGMSQSATELAAQSYKSLRDDNLLAFRITSQSLDSNVEEVYPPEPDSTAISPATDSLQTENVPSQDSTGRN